MRVLVTGATGLVGSHAAEALALAGHDVRVTVRRRSDLRWLDGRPFERSELDLDHPGRLPQALAGVDAVVHAAGITRARRNDEYRRVNAEGTRTLLAGAVAAGVRHVVLVSSLAARGPDQTTAAISPYGASKRHAERIAASFADRVALTTLAVGAVYGPRDSDLLPLFTLARRGLLPVPPRDLAIQPIYVRDLADLIALVVTRPLGVGPWPVAEASRYRWSEVTHLLADALERPVRPLHLPAVAFEALALAAEGIARLRREAPLLDRRRARDLAAFSYTCDTSATEAASGWRARVRLPEGLATTARWYREHGWL